MNVQSTAAMSIQSSAALTVQSSAVMNVTCGAAMNLTAGGVVNLTASLLNVNAAVANFTGIVNAQLVHAQVISGSAYTPGVGNLI